MYDNSITAMMLCTLQRLQNAVWLAPLALSVPCDNSHTSMPMFAL